MSTQVRVPALPESVADATLLVWHKQPGDRVKKDENLVDLETDKVVLEVPAPADGVLGDYQAQEGDLVEADRVLATIEDERAETAAAAKTLNAAETVEGSAASDSRASKPEAHQPKEPKAKASGGTPQLAPAARRLVKELGLDASRIPGTGKDGRINKADVMAWLDRQEAEVTDRDPDLIPTTAAESDTRELPASHSALGGELGRPEQRVPMTRLRARVAERLLEAQQNAAMLTTFNEVDMSAVMALRARYRERFEQTHQIRLGFMSFFVKAAVEALQRFPIINASIDGDDILYHGYYDIGIAVSSARGLVVPVLRDCDQLGMAEIEQGIGEFGKKAKEGTLSFEELSGGTFTITNGGIFGSMLSTPILNPPQSAILGMHKIQERPIAVDGQVVIRPMMYLALSYDHRLIDGRDAVQCLMAIKDALEDPMRLLLRL